MPVFDASDFLDEDFDEESFAAQNDKRIKRRGLEPTKPTGSMSAQHKRMSDNNFYTGVPKVLKKKVKIRESERSTDDF